MSAIAEIKPCKRSSWAYLKSLWSFIRDQYAVQPVRLIMKKLRFGNFQELSICDLRGPGLAGSFGTLYFLIAAFRVYQCLKDQNPDSLGRPD